MGGDVRTVKCPECGTNWTGTFDRDVDEAVCKNCVKHHEEARKDHPEPLIRNGRA